MAPSAIVLTAASSSTTNVEPGVNVSPGAGAAIETICPRAGSTEATAETKEISFIIESSPSDSAFYKRVTDYSPVSI